MPEKEMKAGARIETARDQATAGVHQPGAPAATEGAVSDSEADGPEHEHAFDGREIVRIGFVAIAAMAFWFAGVHLSFPLSLLAYFARSLAAIPYSTKQ